MDDSSPTYSHTYSREPAHLCSLCSSVLLVPKHELKKHKAAQDMDKPGLASDLVRAALEGSLDRVIHHVGL